MSFFVSCGPDVRRAAFRDPGRTLVKSGRPSTSPARTLGGSGNIGLLDQSQQRSLFGESSVLVRPRTSGLPNLPGYQSNRIRAHPTNGFRSTQSFKTFNGVRIEEGDHRAKKAAAINVSRGIAQCSSFGSSVWENAREATPRARNAPPALFNRSSRWLNNAGLVLQWDASITEPVYQSQFEKERVRRCCIYYYLVDDTMTIIEHKQENSGIPQGTLLKRGKLPGLSFDALVCGSEHDVYGKTLKILSCNASTREFLGSQGVDAGEAQPWPQDAFSTMVAQKAEREEQGHGVPRNPMKKYLEATLGNTIASQLGGRGQFLKHDRQVLRFLAVWDNTKRLHGEKMQYTLHYFVADDTAEVLEVNNANCGRDPFPYMLRRQKIPRTSAVPDANGRDDEQPRTDFYHWKDFKIGSIVTVYSRPLLILSVDHNTRRFFEAQGEPLEPDSAMEAEPDAVYDSSPAPWNPFFPGSEEDSLQNCKMLIPKPPPTDFEIQWKKSKGKIEDRVLRFKAKLDSDAYDQTCREFVIFYFNLDNTVQVREPPVRNSGVLGGMFLSRRKYKNPDTGNYFAQQDFFGGAKLKMNRHTLIITDVDRATESYMKACPDLWPQLAEA
eukprot:g4872.t1